LVSQAGQLILLYSAAVQLIAQRGDCVQTLLTLVQTTVSLRVHTGTQVVLQVEVFAGIVQVQVGWAMTKHAAHSSSKSLSIDWVRFFRHIRFALAKGK